MTTDERLAALERRITALERAGAFHSLDPDDGVLETIGDHIQVLRAPDNPANYIVRSGVTRKLLAAAGSLELARAAAARIHATGKGHL